MEPHLLPPCLLGAAKATVDTDLCLKGCNLFLAQKLLFPVILYITHRMISDIKKKM